MKYTIISDNYAECLQRKSKAKGEGNYSVKSKCFKASSIKETEET